MKIKLLLLLVLGLSVSLVTAGTATPTDVEIEGTPCVSSQLQLNFMYQTRRYEVSLNIYDVFSSGFEQPDNVERCAYIGERNVAAVFEGGQLYKLYVEHLVVSAPADSSENERSLRQYVVEEAHMDEPAYCGHTPEDQRQAARSIAGRYVDYPDLNSTYRYLSPPPAPCTTRTLYINLVADYNFSRAYNGNQASILTEMSALTTFLSSAFSATARVTFQLFKTYIFTVPTSGFNSPTSCVQSNPNILLTNFTTWVNANVTASTRPAVWILLTKCMRNGVVGYAGVGVACRATSNTGFASIVGNSGHLIFTHEVGHTMGGGHDNTPVGGIMMPTVGFFDTFSKTSQTQFCSYITGSSIPSTCFVTGGTTTTTRPASTTTTTTRPASTTTTTTRPASTTTTIPVSTTTTRSSATTTLTSTPTVVSQASMNSFVSIINSKRAIYGQPAISWSASAALYASSFTNACNRNLVVNTTYSIAAFYSTGVTPPDLPSIATRIGAVGPANYTCPTDVCRTGVSSFDCNVFRSWMGQDVSGIGCSVTVCPNTSSPFQPTRKDHWSYVACSTTIFSVFTGQRPFPSTRCPATKELEERAVEECPDLCDGRNCGTQKGGNGCPDQVCGSGSCLTGTTCSAEGVCVCTPITTCAMVGACVTTVDNCGELLDCTANCDPTAPCSNTPDPTVCDGLSCGDKWDGCKWVSCGTPLEGQICQDFQLLTCNFACHPNYGICTDSGCKCKPGYVGDGYSCVPEPQPDTFQSLCGSLEWTPLFGSSTSFLVNSATGEFLDEANLCSITHVSSTSNSDKDGLLLSSFSFAGGADSFWAAELTRNGDGGSFGLLYSLDNGYISFTHNGNSKYLLEIVQDQNTFSRKVTSGRWDVGETRLLSLALRVDGTVVPAIDGRTFKAYKLPSAISNTRNQVGFVASSDTEGNFANLQLRTSARITFTVYGIWDEDQIATFVADILSISLDQVANVAVSHVAGTTTASLDLVSSGSRGQNQKMLLTRAIAAAPNPVSAASLATQMEAWVARGVVLRGTFQGITPSVAPELTVAPFSETAASGGSSGLTAGEIVGIVIGSVAGAALVTGAAVFALTSRRRDSGRSDVDQEASGAHSRPKSWRTSIMQAWQPKPAPRGGVDLEPAPGSKHRSITARNLNIADYSG